MASRLNVQINRLSVSPSSCENQFLPKVDEQASVTASSSRAKFTPIKVHKRIPDKGAGKKKRRFKPGKIDTSVVVNQQQLQQQLHPRSFWSLSLAIKQQEENPVYVLPEQAAEDKGKLTVVLDMDETLIHSISSFASPFQRHRSGRYSPVKKACKSIRVPLPLGDTIKVNMRPGLDKFLRSLSKKYEVIVYTAGLKDYAGPLLDKLDPEGKYFRHRLYRESCAYIERDGLYVKNLSFLRRDLARTVLVDNSPHSFLLNLNNGIPVISFYDDGADGVLRKLADTLHDLNECDDVRKKLKKVFGLESSLNHFNMQNVSLTPMPTRSKGLAQRKTRVFDSHSIVQWVHHIDSACSLR